MAGTERRADLTVQEWLKTALAAPLLVSRPDMGHVDPTTRVRPEHRAGELVGLGIGIARRRLRIPIEPSKRIWSIKASAARALHMSQCPDISPKLPKSGFLLGPSRSADRLARIGGARHDLGALNRKLSLLF